MLIILFRPSFCLPLFNTNFLKKIARVMLLAKQNVRLAKRGIDSNILNQMFANNPSLFRLQLQVAVIRVSDEIKALPSPLLLVLPMLA